jgi:hypothetical protein
VPCRRRCCCCGGDKDVRLAQEKEEEAKEKENEDEEVEEVEKENDNRRRNAQIHGDKNLKDGVYACMLTHTFTLILPNKKMRVRKKMCKFSK